jgi:hypothetical protein
MAQVDYFMTDAETSRLLEVLVTRYAARFTPQQHKTPDFPRLTRADEVIKREPDGRFPAEQLT